MHVHRGVLGFSDKLNRLSRLNALHGCCPQTIDDKLVSLPLPADHTDDDKPKWKPEVRFCGVKVCCITPYPLKLLRHLDRVYGLTTVWMGYLEEL